MEAQTAIPTHRVQPKGLGSLSGTGEEDEARRCSQAETSTIPEPAEPPEPAPSTYGCYVWGNVGGGKSLLMDLLVECCGPRSACAVAVRRVHFHEFMHEVHKELHQLRQAGLEKTTQAVARRLAGEVGLLAFDEFQITNISDALIVETLFDSLFQCGVVVVMTSNRPPEDLYKDGLNRHLAIPQFLGLLARRHVAFVELSAARDFRATLASRERVGTQGGAAGDSGVWRDYFRKADESGDGEAEAWLRSVFSEVAGISHGAPENVPVAWGRRILVAEAVPGVCRFTFQQLCGNALNADDYLHLAARFHTFLVSDVPHFSLEQHNEARRFTNLVDCLYERHARLVLSADASPEHLLNKMVVLAGVSLTDAQTTAPMRAAAVGSGAGASAAGMLGTESSDWIRQKPFAPQPATITDVVRSAASAGAGVKAGDDDAATGAGVAGVMAGALGSLQESGFAARRCMSRLLHMQTDEYLLAHQRHREQSSGG